MGPKSTNILKFILNCFLGYALILYTQEQWEGINVHMAIIPWVLMGLYINYKLPLEYSLGYTLLVFPIGADKFFFDYILLHLPEFLRQFPYRTWLFGLIYLTCILLIIRLKWYKIATFLFLLGVFFTFQTLPSSLIKAYQYGTKQEKISSPIWAELRQWKTQKENIYIICLDGYPDFLHQKHHWHSSLDSMLRANHYTYKPIQATIAYTPSSIRQFLTQDFCPQEFTSLNSPKLSRILLESLQQNAPINCQIGINSLLVHVNSASIFFPVFPRPKLNRILEKSFKSFFRTENIVGSPDYFLKFHQDLIQKINADKQHLEFLHFISFHYFMKQDTVYQHQIDEADYWVKNILNRLKTKDPKAHVIIFSDHGERNQKELNPLKNILYVKN